MDRSISESSMEYRKLSVGKIDDVLDDVYAWSRQQRFRGYNKHDGLNSPILSAFFGWGKWPRLVAIQGVMRFPVNLRPLLGVPKTYNPKGLALFVQGLLDRYTAHKRPEFLKEAEELLELLLHIRSPGTWSGSCWGYHYPWRDAGFFAPTNTPNAVVTSFACQAFLDAYRVTGNSHYLETVGEAVKFFQSDLKVLKDAQHELCLSYMPLPMTTRVMDVSILIGSIVAQHAQLSGDAHAIDMAQRLVTYVIRRQTEQYAWFYTDPPGNSHIRHDNYHTGFILDALWLYMKATGDTSFEKHYWGGLEFYAQHLFNENGSPRWMSDKDYPHDIHGAAQGVITFSRHQDKYPGLAFKIAEWALSNLYNKKGRFYYQQTKMMTKKITLLRWCNAWMARALACLIKASLKSSN